MPTTKLTLEPQLRQQLNLHLVHWNWTSISRRP
jgi:hypothetical protein